MPLVHIILAVSLRIAVCSFGWMSLLYHVLIDGVNYLASNYSKFI